MEENQTMTKEKSAFGTTALVLGIIAVVLSFIPIVRFVTYGLAPLALIFGIISAVKKKSVGVSVAGIVLAVAAIILTIALQAATVKAVDTVVEKASKDLDNMTGENTADLLGSDVDVTLGDFVVQKGDFIDDYKLPVTVTNKTDKKASYSIEIEAVDANGKRIEEDTVFVTDLTAKQSQDLEAFTLITSDTAEKLKSATFNIIEVSKY